MEFFILLKFQLETVFYTAVARCEFYFFTEAFFSARCQVFFFRVRSNSGQVKKKGTGPKAKIL